MTTTRDVRHAALAEAITRGGGIISFCRTLKVTHQAVYKWKVRGWVPPARALAIEEAFGIDRSFLIDPTLIALLNSHA